MQPSRVLLVSLVAFACKDGTAPPARADKDKVDEPKRDEGAKDLADTAGKLAAALAELDKELAAGPALDRARDKRIVALEPRLEVRYDRIGRIDDRDAFAAAVRMLAGVEDIRAQIHELGKQSMLDGAAPGKTQRAVLLTGPTDSDAKEMFGAKLVELGPPICGGKPAPGGCDAPEALTYRVGPGERWVRADLATPGDSVPVKRLVPLLPTEILDGLTAGNEASASGILYRSRVTALAKRTKEVEDAVGRAESKLRALAR